MRGVAAGRLGNEVITLASQRRRAPVVFAGLVILALAVAAYTRLHGSQSEPADTDPPRAAAEHLSLPPSDPASAPEPGPEPAPASAPQPARELDFVPSAYGSPMDARETVDWPGLREWAGMVRSGTGDAPRECYPDQWGTRGGGGYGAAEFTGWYPGAILRVGWPSTGAVAELRRLDDGDGQSPAAGVLTGDIGGPRSGVGGEARRDALDVDIEMPGPGCWQLTVAGDDEATRRILSVGVLRPIGLGAPGTRLQVRDPSLALDLLQTLLQPPLAALPAGRPHAAVNLLWGTTFPSDEDAHRLAVFPSYEGEPPVLLAPAALVTGDCRQGTDPVAVPLPSAIAQRLADRGLLETLSSPGELPALALPGGGGAAGTCSSWESLRADSVISSTTEAALRAAREEMEEQARTAYASLPPQRPDPPESADRSPVTAWVEVPGDPPLLAPVHAQRAPLPAVTVTFSGPVDRESVRPVLAGEVLKGGREDGKSYPLTVTWTGELTLQIEPGDLGTGSAVYHLRLAGVKDRQGRSVEVPTISFNLAEPGQSTIWRVPLAPAAGAAGGRPETAFAIADDIAPASVSPDGRYFLFLRKPWPPNWNVHSFQRFPYLHDRETGAWQVWPAVEWDGARWQPDSPYPWVNGNQRLAPDGQIETVTFPPQVEGQVFAPAVSADGRWLAALRYPSGSRYPEAADLLLLDRQSGDLRTYPGLVRPRHGLERGPMGYLRWSPDSRHLYVLHVTTAPANPGREVRSELFLVTPGSPAENGFPPGWRRLVEKPGWFRPDGWSPDSRHVTLYGLGVLNLEGEMVLPGVAGHWSPDGQRLIDYRYGYGNQRATYTLWDLATATGRTYDLSNLQMAYHFVGWAPDGKAVYIGRSSG